MELTTVWFILIAVLWIGYFSLEGFDFGVGMLLPVLAKDETERRVMINTIGPVWDGNEVWVLVAGGATFAAFPEWYATLFSGFYLPLLLILVALIVRGLAFEYRAPAPRGAAGSARWDLALIFGSLVPALLWGVAFANIVRGVPIDADKEFTGNLFTLLNPFGLLGGLVTLRSSSPTARCSSRSRPTATSGTGPATLAVKSAWRRPVRRRRLPGLDAGRHRHRRLGRRCSWSRRSRWSAASSMARAGREGWAFVGTFVTIALAVAGLFVALFPDVMPSSTDAGLLADDHQRRPPPPTR